MNKLVEITNLTKKYEGKVIIDDISLTIPEGRIIGLLGANGAGKTTIIKIITGVMKDYSGKVLINNQSPGKYTKSITSYLPDKTYLSSWMKVKDTVDLFADFYIDFDKNKAIELLNLLNIDINQSVTKLSKGTYEKVQLVIVMSRRSKLYVLDEPLGGVDPASRDIIIDTILTNYNEKSSVILSTQLIQDVERAFDGVIILKNGKILVNGEVDNVRSKVGKSIDEYCREVFKCC
ncbi:ABC transporter ATP-binding protein [Clostridium estertheticum]|uniref:ABC transporter ATP-binding protein n=1 Tax=Clostridium estertheticum TaxID=238834 RepID=UPI001C0AE4DA|nr:ABC transporter ATP-binding protein [Clostridium estertheticum]MBU3215390.1 ABC transporter ATP-binding protein [Clostridium estertheticum]WAG57015.1 ABC transporter ATP-binding protein [Clostridium estertheticum]